MEKIKSNQYPNKKDTDVYADPHEKIDAIKREDDFIPVKEPVKIEEKIIRSYDDPHLKIDQVIKDKTKESEPVSKSQQVQETYDNLVFRKEVRENPIVTDVNRKVMGVVVVNLNKFIDLQIWKRSIYVTDKLIRLAMSAKLEFLKRYLSKKRAVPLNMLWIVLIMVAVVVVILVVLFLLPNLGVI